jgi:hypothetical protein
MAERNVQQGQQARDELRRVVGFSAADEIQKLDGLKKRERSATPNLPDYAPGSSSNEGGAAGCHLRRRSTQIENTTTISPATICGAFSRKVAQASVAVIASP